MFPQQRLRNTKKAANCFEHSESTFDKMILETGKKTERPPGSHEKLINELEISPYRYSLLFLFRKPLLLTLSPNMELKGKRLVKTQVQEKPQILF